MSHKSFARLYVLAHHSLPFNTSLPKKNSHQKTLCSCNLSSSRGSLLLGGTINLRNVAEKVEDTAGVTPLVVIP